MYEKKINNFSSLKVIEWINSTLPVFSTFVKGMVANIQRLGAFIYLKIQMLTKKGIYVLNWWFMNLQQFLYSKVPYHESPQPIFSVDEIRELHFCNSGTKEVIIPRNLEGQAIE